MRRRTFFKWVGIAALSAMGRWEGLFGVHESTLADLVVATLQQLEGRGKFEQIAQAYSNYEATQQWYTQERTPA